MQPAPTSQTPSIAVGAGLGLLLTLVPSLLMRVVPVGQIGGMLVQCIACLGTLAAGAFAVRHWTDKTRTTLRAGEGAKLGLYVGAVMLIANMAVLLLVWLFSGMPSMGDLMASSIEQSGQQLSQEQIDQALAIYQNPAMIGVVFVFVTLFTLGIPALGGLLGASIFKRGGEQPSY